MDRYPQRSVWLRLQRLIPYALLTWIATIFGMPVLYPYPFLRALSLDSDRHFLPLIIVMAAMSVSIFAGLILALLRASYRRLRRFRHLPAHARGTVTVEFLMSFPALLLMFGSIFAMAEIAHAQIVFRYAAYSAARAGSVANYPVNDEIEFSLSTTDANRMRAAAVTALSGIDGHDFESTAIPEWLSNAGLGDGQTLLGQLSSSYIAACPKFGLHWKYFTSAWVNADNFTSQFINADQALVSFKPSFVTSNLIDAPFSHLGSGLNLTAPPLIQLEMEYELALRPISVFWIVCPKGQGGYPCITLERTAKYTTTGSSVTPLQMQTTGGRIDKPYFPPLVPGSDGISVVPGDFESYSPSSE